MFGPQHKYCQIHRFSEIPALFLRALASTVIEIQHWRTVWLQLFERWPCMKHNHRQSIRGEKNISVLARNIACYGILKVYLVIENIQSVLKVLYILLHWIGFLFKKIKKIKKKLSQSFSGTNKVICEKIYQLFSFVGRYIFRSRILLTHVQRLYSAYVFMPLIYSSNICRKSWGILVEPFPDNDYIDHFFGFWVVFYETQSRLVSLTNRTISFFFSSCPSGETDMKASQTPQSP